MQTVVIVILALSLAVLLWRFLRVRRILRKLDRLAKESGTREALMSPLWDHDEALESLGHSLLNLHDEAVLERDLERARRRLLEALLHELSEPIFILNENLEIRFSNDAARQMFPSEQEHEGRSLIEVCIDHRIVDTVALALNLGAKTQDRIKRRALDRAERPEHTFLVEAEPLSSSFHGVPSAWLVIRDITLQLETEQLRRDFLANASHELRTPLSIISGYLEMMDDGQSSSAMAAKAVPVMRKHALRISRLVEDMLTISKLESQGAEDLLNREAFDLQECLHSSLDHLQPLLEQKKVRLKVLFPEQAPMLYGDRHYWDQIFFNLVENAIKENPEPGLHVAITATIEQGRYQIEITDDGVGIPAADLSHVFKRFYRVRKDRGQSVKGTGLGLSIVRRAVEAHRGTIAVRSRPGIATTFTISVPLATGQEARESVPKQERS